MEERIALRRLEDLRGMLANARAAVEYAASNLVHAREDLAQTPQAMRVQECQEWLDACKQDRDEADAKLREALADFFAATGEKAPTIGLAIKMYTVVTIEDPEQVRAWALANAPYLLKPDDKEVKRLAKDHPIAGVTVGQEPRATIATDLNLYVTEPPL